MIVGNQHILIYRQMLQDISYVASRSILLPHAIWTWRWSARPLFMMGTRRRSRRRPNQNGPSSTKSILPSATKLPLFEVVSTQDFCPPFCNAGADYSGHGVDVSLGFLNPRNGRGIDTFKSWRKNVSIGVIKVIALSFMWPLARAADITTDYLKPTVSSKVRFRYRISRKCDFTHLQGEPNRVFDVSSMDESIMNSKHTRTSSR